MVDAFLVKYKGRFKVWRKDGDESNNWYRNLLILWKCMVSSAIILILQLRRRKLKLYHGTNYSSAMNIIKNGINLNYSKPYLDFGAGFYTTPSYEHAAITAIRTTDKYNARCKTQEEAYIVVLNYYPKNELDLTIKSYPRHGEEWGHFILNNRLTKSVLKAYNLVEHNQDLKYDVCCGEIADGNIVNIAHRVNEGELSPRNIDFNKFLKKNGKVYPLQYSFHTQKAISCITVVSCDIIKNIEKYYKLIVRR